MKRILLGALCAVALAGCGDHEAERKAQAAAEAQAKAQAADDLAKQYDAAAKSGNWDLARIHGAALLQQYPGSDAAARIEPGYGEVKAKGEAARELRRMQAAWEYSQVPAGKGMQRSAMLYSRDKVDVDGSGPKPVQLVFRDHPEWKRSAYLVLQAGDFRCAAGCKVQLKADDAAPRAAAAWRPNTDEAIAMFISDDKALWKLARKTTVLQIEFPVKAGGTRTAVFETGGLDGSKMPGWD
ncbi:hypothetical protein [Xanthomonas bundabergensis]|uniref:hypothetical protein n=1 Tax=Xanthomonas bundabergensis TaxID=3160842 RepID=UPI00351729AB